MAPIGNVDANRPLRTIPRHPPPTPAPPPDAPKHLNKKRTSPAIKVEAENERTEKNAPTLNKKLEETA